MRRFRVGACTSAAFAVVLIALGATNCAAPTQIRIDVRADRGLCGNSDDKTVKPGGKVIQSTGIAVTTPDQIDKADLSIFEGAGCDAPGDQIGILTITPSGSKDAEVGVRIVSGVTQLAQYCKGPKYEGCIVAKRTVRFVPNQTVSITVIMGEKCLSKDCGKLECNPENGECVQPSQIQEDGGVSKPPPDSGKDSPTTVVDGEADTSVPIIDAGVDACSNCKGVCTNGKDCNVKCDNGAGAIDCSNLDVCGAGLATCTIDCPTGGKCTNTRCSNFPGTCAFDCHNQSNNPRCVNIACAAGTCTVQCREAEVACNGVFLDGGSANTVTCTPVTGATTVSCENVNCLGNCTRTCGVDASACGPNATCAPPAGCTQWEDAGL